MKDMLLLVMFFVGHYHSAFSAMILLPQLWLEDFFFTSMELLRLNCFKMGSTSTLVIDEILLNSIVLCSFLEDVVSH